MSTNPRKPLKEALGQLLPQLKSKEMTQKEAAQVLGITPRHLRRLLPEGFKPARKGAEQLEKAAVERQKSAKTRRDSALLLYKRQISVEVAAKRAGCSERTMFRYLKRLREMLGATDS